MKVCICGSGSLGHVCAAVLSSREGVSVSLLSRKPDLWAGEVVATDPDGKQYRGRLDRVSSYAQEVIPGSDLVLLCLPGFAIRPTLEKIKPFVGNTPVGSIVSSSGFFFEAMEILPGQPLFGFQRVPFIARTEQYGHSALLLGYKKQLALATVNINDPEGLRLVFERLWDTPTTLLDSYLEAAISNSNPILHTGRLYSMFGPGSKGAWDHNVYFYREWTLEASRIIMAMDSELSLLLDKLNVSREHIPTLLDYYQSRDASSLTRKLQSITAFRDILSPMKQTADGTWIPDFQSRYFTEDFPCGLHYIKLLNDKYSINAPTIDTVYNWGMGLLNTNANESV